MAVRTICLRTVCPRLIRAKKQSVRFVIRTVCPRLINPYDLSTPNQGTPYNLSPYGLSEANQSKKAVRTICLPYDLSSVRFVCRPDLTKFSILKPSLVPHIMETHKLKRMTCMCIKYCQHYNGFSPQLHKSCFLSYERQ